MSNARRTLAVGAVRQVIAKFSRIQISSETAIADRNHAMSARKEDGGGKCASWSGVELSLPRKTYPKSIKSTQVGIAFVIFVIRMDTHRKIHVRTLVLLVRK